MRAAIRSRWLRPAFYREMAPHAAWGLAQGLRYTVQFFCIGHLLSEHVFEIRSCSGSSMLPTLADEGDTLLHVRLPLYSTYTELRQRASYLFSRFRHGNAGDDDDAASMRYASAPYGWGRKRIGGPASIKADQAQGTGLRLGDIVVALSPLDPERAVCKRVLGLPGDTVCVDPRMRPLPESAWRARKLPSHPQLDHPASHLPFARPGSDGRGSGGTTSASDASDAGEAVDLLLRSMDSSSPDWHGTDRSTRKHDHATSARLLQQGPVRATGEVQYVTVPSGHVWLAGDNLGNSTDSRHYGPVPMGLVRGKVVARVYPRPTWLTNPMLPT